MAELAGSSDERCPHAGGGEPMDGRPLTKVAASCPHAGGGEPITSGVLPYAFGVVPTLVGVNRF